MFCPSPGVLLGQPPRGMTLIHPCIIWTCAIHFSTRTYILHPMFGIIFTTVNSTFHGWFQPQGDDEKEDHLNCCWASESVNPTWLENLHGGTFAGKMVQINGGFSRHRLPEGSLIETLNETLRPWYILIPWNNLSIAKAKTAKILYGKWPIYSWMI